MKQQRCGAGLALLGAALGLASCGDLEITRVQNPDRDTALSDANAVEQLISSSFRTYYNAMHVTGSISVIFPAIGDEITTTTNSGGTGAWDMTKDLPRAPFNNDPGATSGESPTGVGVLWNNLHSIVASANDGLQVIDGGLRIREGNIDRTHRARTFAKFMQGLAWGQIALVFDEGIVLDETQRLAPGADALRDQINAHRRSHTEVAAKALAALDAAIVLAQQDTFTIPGSWFSSPTSATPNVSSAALVRIANTYAARILVYNARTPAERAAVDWNRVLSYTNNAITQDFGPLLVAGTGGLTSSRYGMQAQSSSSRVHYNILGPADVSGRYQAWVNGPYSARRRFDIETPDRRIQGATPGSAGTYFRYRADDLGYVTGGQFLPHYSAYQWFRNNGSTNSGQAVLVWLAEIRLIRAEALARTNQAAAAAQLVNISRMAASLPGVTAAGVPQSPTCVPKTEAGACGSLLDAIRYERGIESVAGEATRPFADNRGWGRLTPGSPLHFPVPGVELNVLRLPFYTWGGTSAQSAPLNWPISQ
jgi:hypothetical protein